MSLYCLFTNSRNYPYNAFEVGVDLLPIGWKCRRSVISIHHLGYQVTEYELTYFAPNRWNTYAGPAPATPACVSLLRCQTHNEVHSAVSFKNGGKNHFNSFNPFKLSDMVILHSLIWGYWPDTYLPQFPLPVFRVNSLFKYFWDVGGVIVIIVFFTADSLSLTAIFEECLMRFAVTYNVKLILLASHGIL